jgi:hypothetical protein
LEHEAHPKTTLYGVVFQKIEWAPASRALFKDRNCRNWEATLPVLRRFRICAFSLQQQR